MENWREADGSAVTILNLTQPQILTSYRADAEEPDRQVLPEPDFQK